MKQYILIALTFVMATVNAQNELDLSYHLPQKITYDSNIPTPKSVVGHEVGEWHITHDKLLQYAKAVANASDRIPLRKEEQPLKADLWFCLQ